MRVSLCAYAWQARALPVGSRLTRVVRVTQRSITASHGRNVLATSRFLDSYVLCDEGMRSCYQAIEAMNANRLACYPSSASKASLHCRALQRLVQHFFQPRLHPVKFKQHVK